MTKFLLTIAVMAILATVSISTARACGTIKESFAGFNLSGAPSPGNAVWFQCSDGTTYAAAAGYNGANEYLIQNLVAHVDAAKISGCSVTVQGAGWQLTGVFCQ